MLFNKIHKIIKILLKFPRIMKSSEILEDQCNYILYTKKIMQYFVNSNVISL